LVERAAAVLQVWLPGEEGADAVVDALYGDLNPGGKLAVTVPRGVGQVPTYYGHKPSGGHSHWKYEYVDMSNLPLYPFGFGLSYTTFALDNLHVNRTTAQAGDSFEVTIDVTNTGNVAGDEVVQLYLRLEGTSVTRPVKELKGFKRVPLQPGETRTVRFTAQVNQMAFLDRAMRLVIEPSALEIMVGTSSNDTPHRATIEIRGETVEVTRAGAFFSSAEIL
jgi:beta-glucosidase